MIPLETHSLSLTGSSYSEEEKFPSTKHMLHHLCILFACKMSNQNIVFCAAKSLIIDYSSLSKQVLI